jgi:hypothetical protein
LTLLFFFLLELSFVEPLQRSGLFDEEAIRFGMFLELVAVHLAH